MSAAIAGEIEGVDLEILGAWMDDQGLPGGEIETMVPLEGGTQNILLRFERGGRAFVLRRPPVHKRANSDETMRREARVLAALKGSDVPHPGLIAACPDEALIGAAFYLMEPVDGFNAAQGVPESHRAPEVRRQMGFSMAEGIASLAALALGPSGSRVLAGPKVIWSGRSRAGGISWRAIPSWTAIPVPRSPAWSAWRVGSRRTGHTTRRPASCTAIITSQT